MISTGFSEINEDRLKYRDKGFWYCEIALTGQCNFNCSYCNRFKGDVDKNRLFKFIDQYKSTLRHIQLTGGEPTQYKDFVSLCKFITDKKIKLGISTNGSAAYCIYESIAANMFSISLDDYDFDILQIRGYKNIQVIIENIKLLAKITYVNVGLVVDSLNCNRIESVIKFILDLGVNDIKLSISTKDEVEPKFGNIDYSKYPILNYRVNRFRAGKSMRGISQYENFKCELLKNDISIVGDKHYPCLVYAREKGDAIGLLNESIYEDRLNWYKNHQPNKDKICQKYCMDFKCEFNSSFTGG